MSRVLITGGAGFIGSSLIKAIDQDFEIVVLDNFSPQIHGENYTDSYLLKEIDKRATIINGDVCDPNIYEQIENIEYIIHLAAETGTGQSMYEIQRYTDVNISGTALLLEKLVTNNPNLKKVIVASSRAVYGEGKYKNPENGEVIFPESRLEYNLDQGVFNPLEDDVELEMLPTDESSGLKPTSVYGVTKLSQEMLLMNVCTSFAIPSVALRFQNVFGPGQSLKNPYTGILSIFSNLLRKKNPINIFEDGKESRDFVFIDDVVQSLKLALTKQEADGEVFNVGTGIATSVLEVANTLKEHYNSDSELKITGNYRIGDIRHNVADISKIKQKLGFSPEVDFKLGIKLFTDWVLSQEVVESKYETSLKEMRDRGLLK